MNSYKLQRQCFALLENKWYHKMEGSSATAEVSNAWMGNAYLYKKSAVIWQGAHDISVSVKDKGGCISLIISINPLLKRS